MSAALLCLACAIVVAPQHHSHVRLAALHGPRRRRRRGLDPRLAVLGCFPAYFVGGIAAAGAAALLGFVSVLRYTRATATRAAVAEREKLLDLLDVVIGELRVGAHPAAACQAAADDGTGEAAAAFAVAAARSTLGGSGASGLRRVGSVIAPELDRIADAWSIAERHGLAVAEILVAVRADALGRIRFRSRTESELAGARATGAVLAALPLVGIGLGQLMGAAPLAVLFGGGVGGILLVLGTAFVCAGMLWTDAIAGGVLR